MLEGLPSRRQILINFAALVSGMGFARLMTAAALILLARQVGPASFGQFLACFSLAKLTSVAFSWGLDGWLLWRGGSATHRQTIATQSGVALVWKLLLGIAWFSGLMLISRWLDPAVFPASALLVTALFVWTDDLTNTVWSVFKSALQNDVILRLITVVQFMLVVATLALIQLGAHELLSFLWARLAVSVAGCLIAVWVLNRRMGLAFDRAAMLPILRAASPFAASFALALIYERVDVTIVAQYLGATQAGIYGPASTVVTTLFLIPQAAYSVMVPVFTRAQKAEGSSFGRMLRLLAGVNIVMGVTLAAGLALAATWLIQLLYGPQYAAAGEILTILSLVLGLRCVTFALAAAVVGAGQQKERLYAQAAAAVLSIAVNLAIVTAWGIRGVAWVYVLTELVLLIGYGLILAFSNQRRAA